MTLKSKWVGWAESKTTYDIWANIYASLSLPMGMSSTHSHCNKARLFSTKAYCGAFKGSSAFGLRKADALISNDSK